MATTSSLKTEPESPSTSPSAPYSIPQWAASHISIDPALQQQTPNQQSATSAPYAHYSYTAHYPQASYAGYHAAYAAQVNATPQLQAQVQAQGQAAAIARQGGQASGADSSDIASLNDALGSAGVDLRAEEETLQRSYDPRGSFRSEEDRTRKQPTKPSFDVRFLGATMRAIIAKHKVTTMPEDAVNYLALALRVRLQELVTAMVAAARHRNDAQFERPASMYRQPHDSGDGMTATPMWSIVVRSDVAKQLAALEKVEREEEMKIRRERKERQDAAATQAAAMASQAFGGASGSGSGGSGAGVSGGVGATGGGTSSSDHLDDESGSGGGPKKKRKKEGPGVTARNMSEDVRKKMSNAVATQAAGLGKYAWMTAANAAPSPSATSAVPKPKPVAAVPAAVGTTAPTGTTLGTTGVTASGPLTVGMSVDVPGTNTATAMKSSWARPYVPTKKLAATPAQATDEDTRTAITLRDALFVVEKEKGHGGGRGAAFAWV